MAEPAEYFSLLLREAISEARAAGLADLADTLERTAFASYTSSSELLGETGLAIVAFLRAGGKAIPPGVVAKLSTCLQQVQEVWPRIRR